MTRTTRSKPSGASDERAAPPDSTTEIHASEPADTALPGANAAGAAASDPAVLEQVEAVRARVHAAFGQAVLAMTVLPRYRNLPLADLTALLLEPLIRDRVAIASTAPADGTGIQAPAGIAIWASVSEEVDARIREQVAAGVFPVRLKPEDWTSGDINWLLDVIAPNRRLATSVVANLKQVVKQGDLRIHPMATRQVDAEAMKKLGAAPLRPEKE